MSTTLVPARSKRSRTVPFLRQTLRQALPREGIFAARSFFRLGTGGAYWLGYRGMKAPMFLLLLPLLLLATVRAAGQFVTVGDPGNPNDPLDYDNNPSTNYGAVGSTYAIGTYEVTLNQYTAFLNAKAASDPLSLYNPGMATDLNSAGISRSGSSGSYVYAVIGDGSRPVTYVSFYDALRYANWLHNGSGSGSTETGAYTLLGGTAAPSNGLTVTRNGGAQYWIPSENEWYKAAYYQPAAAGGDADGYWLYPTGSNAIPNSRNGSVSDANSGSSPSCTARWARPGWTTFTPGWPTVATSRTRACSASAWR